MAASESPFRKFLPDLSLPRFTIAKTQDPHTYAKEFIEGGNPPWLHGLFLHWRKLFKEPYHGVTTDGKVRPDLFTLRDDGMPIASIVSATEALLSKLDAKQVDAVKYHIDSPEWRTWSNPEFLLSNKGIRLEEVTPDVRDATMAVLKATLSPEGYDKAVGAMRVNGFLGKLCDVEKIMNEWSYNFCLFGEPAVDAPWGFSFYGHHLCLNVFLYKTQVVMSPWFTGAEPNLIDDGPHKGTRIMTTEEDLGLRLMQSLPAEKQAQAQIYKLLKDPAMPHGRWNHDDQRHLCGAYRDNRVVPYEGILVSEMAPEQQDLVVGILDSYLIYLPAQAKKLKLDEARAWFKETHFCWIGGYGDEDPFYYRVQSPVILVEFDHHSGVFLNNKEPAKFHIHTLLRTPNAGDYGVALRPLIEFKEQDFVWEGARDQ